jgi:hypothetical protein
VRFQAKAEKAVADYVELPQRRHAADAASLSGSGSNRRGSS